MDMNICCGQELYFFLMYTSYIILMQFAMVL